MTNYSPISKKSQYLADKACLVDSASISKIFTDIKKKDMLIEPIEINTNDYKDLIQDIQTQKEFITNSINSLNEDQKSVVDYKTIKHLLCDIKLN